MLTETSSFETKDWRQRLDIIVETMREMSSQTDPQATVRAYMARMQQIVPADHRISLSRRDLKYPEYRITRFSGWKEVIDPWKQKEQLPHFSGGLLAELIYGNEPVILGDVHLAKDEPAAEFLSGYSSLMAIPLYDRGEALNMNVAARRDPDAFDYEQLPEVVWRANLFGRATHNLVLAEQLQAAYSAVDRELRVIADLQRSLLPTQLPKIPGLELAAHYQTSRRAGGDYYDVFALPDGKWGLLIADVSGHGTPAAVMMAVTHAIAHTYPGPPSPPSKMLEFLNYHLASRYTAESGAFVTAFYGIYDRERRELTYSSAGHNPPRIKRCGEKCVDVLDGARRFPLGIVAGQIYEDSVQQLKSGDQIIFYTDGITEAHSPTGEMFGVERLDSLLAGCGNDAGEMIEIILGALKEFTEGADAHDDRTMLVANVT